MSRALHVSDETYQTIETLAREQGTTPEAVAETLLKERLAERASIQRQNAEWSAGLNAALARAEHRQNPEYHDIDAFFAALDDASGESSDE